MHRKLLCMSIAAGMLSVPALAGAFTGHELAGQARISLHQARSIALRAFPGTITDQELEREHGGSGLRYSFDIRRDGMVHEVGVDAISGKVLENSPEGAHPD
jgi:uncharacterized membrane protein YkoI